MTRDEIYDRIYSCTTEEEIKSFVQERLNELEQNSQEETIGQGYTDIYKDFISSKTHYKPAAKFGDVDCPDLLYDDMTDYIDLIKEIKKNNFYNFTTLFSTIFFLMARNLKSGDEIDRLFVYSKNKNNGKVSIKDIKDFSCAFCSERAGLAHNMFKFLGLDSELICGTKDGVNHAYNLVFPNGYEETPAIVYDPSSHIDYLDSNNRKISFGYFVPLSKEEYDMMLVGQKVELDLDKSSKKLDSLYNLSERFLEYSLCDINNTYGIGVQSLKDDNKVK